MFITLTRIFKGGYVPATIQISHLCMFHVTTDDGYIKHTSRKEHPHLPEERTMVHTTYLAIEVLESPEEIKKRVYDAQTKDYTRIGRRLKIGSMTLKS